MRPRGCTACLRSASKIAIGLLGPVAASTPWLISRHSHGKSVLVLPTHRKKCLLNYYRVRIHARASIPTLDEFPNVKVRLSEFIKRDLKPMPSF